jgi:hypothetical protein
MPYLQGGTGILSHLRRTYKWDDEALIDILQDHDYPVTV